MGNLVFIIAPRVTAAEQNGWKVMLVRQFKCLLLKNQEEGLEYAPKCCIATNTDRKEAEAAHTKKVAGHYTGANKEIGLWKSNGLSISIGTAIVVGIVASWIIETPPSNSGTLTEEAENMPVAAPGRPGFNSFVRSYLMPVRIPFGLWRPFLR